MNLYERFEAMMTSNGLIIASLNFLRISVELPKIGRFQKRSALLKKESIKNIIGICTKVVVVVLMSNLFLIARVVFEHPPYSIFANHSVQN